MFANLSLKYKIFITAVGIGLTVAIFEGATSYFSNVVPVKERVEKQMIQKMDSLIRAEIDFKVQAGIIGSSAISMETKIIEALQVEDREELVPIISGVRDHYAKQTDYKNIGTQIMTADGRSLIKSWDPESWGQDLTNSPLIQRALKEKHAFGSLAIGDQGVSVVAVSPIFDHANNDEFLGMASFKQGLKSVVKDVKKTVNGDWILLIDRNYIKKVYGKMPVLDGNTPVGTHYILANNNWFNPEAIKTLQSDYREINGQESAVYLHGHQVIVNIPAYDEDSHVMGRHVFLMDDSEYMAPIQQAEFAAWEQLIVLSLGIIALSLIIVYTVIRLVIRPLSVVQQQTDKILTTGDFSLRIPNVSKDEVGQTAVAINTLLGQVSTALDEANDSVAAMAKGDFTQCIRGEYQGDLHALKTGVNQSIDTIQKVMDGISHMMQALREGDYQFRLSLETEGDYARIINDAQHAIAETDAIISDINRVMTDMQNGRFQSRVEADANGQLEQLKERINTSLESLNNAMNDIIRVVGAQSEGNLTLSIDNDYQGDLATLKNAINQSAKTLSESIAVAVNAANSVQHEANDLAKDANDLSGRIQEQAAAIEETSATMEEMNSAVQNNTENAHRASQVVQQVQHETLQADQVMKRTIEAMNGIHESSNEISDIISLIDSIAFQTNLLALNAAVEAARAGEHGRGFAVVAGEVRALAQKSAEAAKDIKNLIDANVERIGQGTALVDESGQVMQQITQSISEVTRMIQQISHASSEQAEGVNQVYQAISDIDSATQQNSAVVERTSASAAKMNHQASELSINMAHFKT
ncbi:methyl-accepting chemotaxis protein [Thiomicrorhabdus sp.]|uniref:methyl-accepting chemotaxis protein n=1 Tax=Thiomicrorhabdus sp. TaxID=2039724 RepID=UPI0029C75A16|nr:methyl-accepting chemotaxis protein [Thiomicrorhabdus sp.]